MSPLPGHIGRRYKPKGPLAGQVLGVYKGPPRKVDAPKLTPYRIRLLNAIAAGEVKRGTGQYLGAWRWHAGGASSTVTKWIQPMVGCKWAVEVGAHLELTELGREVLAGAPNEPS